MRFESTNLDTLYPALDCIAWMDAPSTAEIAQFAGIDPRTAGKLLKNANQIGLVDKVGDGFVLVSAYPYKGSEDQKTAVVSEAFARFPLIITIRQFLKQNDNIETALRKAATIHGISPFKENDLAPLLKWANSLKALTSELSAEDMVEKTVSLKQKRHKDDESKKVAFLSHSSLDKEFIRQLATDLNAANVDVWLDEQRILVGDSIPEKVAQGLADSDYFLIAISKHSINSEWVKVELNNALMKEIAKKKLQVLPLKLDDSEIPDLIADKKYADFSESYKKGFADLIAAF